MPLTGLRLNVPVVPEKSTFRLSGKILDHAGAAIPSVSLTTFTLTLYDKETGGVINGRNGTNILNANGGAVDTSGNFTWDSDPADSPINDTTLRIEKHMALLQWTWVAGAEADRHEFEIPVKNMVKVS
jgi:hypothetical protein